jgi:hypothetical protein
MATPRSRNRRRISDEKAGAPPSFASMRLEGQPGEPLREAWAYLTPAEAELLLAALLEWEREAQPRGWHAHVGELTIAVGEPDPG